MNINATLFVQAANFFIAYLLFRFILLKPAYAEIKQDADERALLEDLVATDKRQVEQERQMQRNAWHQFHQWCGDYLPRLISPPGFFRVTVPKIQIKEPHEVLKKTVQKQLVEQIIRGAKDRYGF